MREERPCGQKVIWPVRHQHVWLPKEQHNALPFPSALASFYLYFQIDQPGLGLPSRDYYECTGAYQEVRGLAHHCSQVMV